MCKNPAPLVALLSTFALFGCAAFSPDGGMTVVADVDGETIHKDVVSIRTEDDTGRAQEAVRRLLRQTLSVDATVQVALLNNRGLQASYKEAALAEANMGQDMLTPNATLSY